MGEKRVIYDYRILSAPQLIDAIVDENYFVYDSLTGASTPSTVKLSYHYGVTITTEQFVPSGYFGLSKKGNPATIVANIWTKVDQLDASDSNWYVEVWGDEMYPVARQLIRKLAKRFNTRATVVLKSNTLRQLY